MEAYNLTIRRQCPATRDSGRPCKTPAGRGEERSTTLTGSFACLKSVEGSRLNIAYEASQFLTNFIPHPAKDDQACRLITLYSRRVLEAPVNSLGPSGEDGTALIGVVAYGDHVIELLPQKFIHRLRTVAGNINPDLPHRLNRLRRYAARCLRPSGFGRNSRYKESILVSSSEVL